MIDDSNSITMAAPARLSVSRTDALHLSVVVIRTRSGEKSIDSVSSMDQLASCLFRDL